jgi:hypothetical protein
VVAQAAQGDDWSRVVALAVGIAMGTTINDRE